MKEKLKTEIEPSPKTEAKEIRIKIVIFERDRVIVLGRETLTISITSFKSFPSF